MVKVGVAVEADVAVAIHASICIVVGTSVAVWAQANGSLPEPLGLPISRYHPVSRCQVARWAPACIHYVLYTVSGGAADAQVGHTA